MPLGGLPLQWANICFNDKNENLLIFDKKYSFVNPR